MDKQQRQVSSSSTLVGQASTTQLNNPKVDHTSALIQFKLSDGSVVRQSFDGTVLLDHLYQFAADQEAAIGNSLGAGESICLISAFPRRTFGPDEINLSIRDAGFMPNVSLNIGRISATVETTTEDEDMQQANDTQDEHFIRQPVVDPHRSRTRRITDRSPFARQNRVINPNWNWGQSGHRLGDDDIGDTPTTIADHSIEEEEEEGTNRRRNMLTAIQQRVLQNDNMDNKSTQRKKVNRDIKSLKETCTSQVAAILSSSSKDTQRLLKSLVYVSPNLANLLLNRLMETRKLDRLSISRLIRHCYLQQVILDSYVYATDSLLEELSNATTLTKLVLHGCDLITDAGIKQLETLRYLDYLDISNCKITDKGLKSITELPSLLYLNMSKTRITDGGLQWFATHSQCQQTLETLLLSGCKSIKSSNTFTSIQGFIALVHLSLGGTGIGKQEMAPQSMKHLNKSLETLDVSNTGITDDDMIQLVAGFGRLKELKLGGCTEITTSGLARFAKGLLHLEMIQFPNREHELDDILIRFIDTPLRHLDLTGFLNVTDDGVKHIAKMTQLNYLSLTGTKVTDDGIAQLKDLQELEKLYLDQTSVSDRGLLSLNGLIKLNTLSLGRTQISNIALVVMGNNEETGYASQLRTLNLQKCHGVSDKGVKALAGMTNLTNLNLDHTEVSLQCSGYLKDLEFLKPVRLLGINKQEDDTMDID
ncbi:hypothetical protein BC941DRAFT_33511 [Chlamydoabsidia padenii]|nr:hypothetical protein BC941DRAFT_33511 [Chlamydoabsidia padenii]